jgi:hypothetical protein
MQPMLVMLIKNDGENIPPLGSIGVIVGVDESDLLVEFPRHPCPAGPETAWLCAEHWLLPIEPPSGGFYTDTETGMLEPFFNAT